MLEDPKVFSGQVLRQVALSGRSNPISLGELPAGVYFVEVADGRKVCRERLVVQWAVVSGYNSDRFGWFGNLAFANYCTFFSNYKSRFGKSPSEYLRD